MRLVPALAADSGHYNLMVIHKPANGRWRRLRWSASAEGAYERSDNDSAMPFLCIPRTRTSSTPAEIFIDASKLHR